MTGSAILTAQKTWLTMVPKIAATVCSAPWEATGTLLTVTAIENQRPSQGLVKLSSAGFVPSCSPAPFSYHTFFLPSTHSPEHFLPTPEHILPSFPHSPTPPLDGPRNHQLSTSDDAALSQLCHSAGFLANVLYGMFAAMHAISKLVHQD